MNQQQRHNNEHPNPDTLARPAIVRAAADGEQWAIDFLADATDQPADDNARLAFERTLRERTARVMQSAHPAAPDALRAAIRTALADDHPDQRQTDQPGVLARIGPPALGILATAAVVALSAAVLFQALNTTPGQPPDSAAVRQIAGFVHAEHDAFAGPGPINPRFNTANTPGDATEFVESAIGLAPDTLPSHINALNQRGLRLARLTRCNRPLPNINAKSVHLLFQPTDPNQTTRTASVPVSVFIARAGQDDNLSTNACYACIKSQRAGQPVVFWKADGFVYVVHAASPQAVAAARRALQAPDLLQVI